MDPPTCVQNAMMTKDKKPFTYTPGGIDLSEVRSPRMARRIERNANLGGAGETPRPPPTQIQDYNNLPPSTLAAMRPQPQVQVFPSGPPPPAPMKGRAPPPPPPPMNAPPPPPPPSGPMPTQKVRMSDNQVLERPDMTKIIPEDPIRLLRKTGGPQPRKTVVDQMFEEAKAGSRPGPKSPPASPQKAPYYEQEQRYQPSAVERGGPIPPVPQPQQYQPPSPPHQPQPQQYKPPSPPYQPQPQQYQPPSPQYQPQPPKQAPPLSHQTREQPRYQPPVNSRQPEPTQSYEKPEVKTSTAHLGSLYIPPANQQQRRIVSPPTPPERSPDTPTLQTPPLKEAPKPWQIKKPQQDEIPSWAKKDVEEGPQTQSPTVQQQQPQEQPQRWAPVKAAQPPQPQYNQQYQQQPYGQQPFNQQPVGLRIEIRTKPNPQYQDEPEERKPNAVYITQPVVLQHPGNRIPSEPKHKPQPKVDSQGARVIPIQYEGSSPSSAGSDRSLNRQQSWGSNPTQSNSFKVIQKLTNTDGDDYDEITPMMEHPPSFPQNFQQVDQMGRMKINDGDQMMNRFNQVSRGQPPQSNKGPQVRTIPIQLEDDEPPQPYVHPSQQVVPEPKKYTGSSIPSRSFKILQAMTAPNNSASADDPNEASPYDQWGFDPCYPPYPPPPYWHEYYQSYYFPEPHPGLSKRESSEVNSKSPQRQTSAPRQNSGRQTPVSSSGRQTPVSSSGRQTPVSSNGKQTPVPNSGRLTPVSGRRTPTSGRLTPTPRLNYNPRPSPVPFWGYMPPPPYPYALPKKGTTAEESDTESTTNPRSTPSPYWGYQYYPSDDTEDEGSEARTYPPYPPYFDPYYHYYYGMPSTMYPPFPHYPMSEPEDYLGYSSTEEMAYYNRNTNSDSNSSISSAKKDPIPTLFVKEYVSHNAKVEEPETDQETVESESEIEEDEDKQNLCPLKSIKSVTDIKVYYDVQEPSEDETSLEGSEGTNEDIEEQISIAEEDGYPHQLSIILEESERTDSRLRSISAMSDSTTIANKSDDEEEPIQLINSPFKFTVRVTEEDDIKTIVVEDGNLKSFDTTPCVFEFKGQNVQDVTDESNIKQETVVCKIDRTEEVIDEGKESDESEDWWGIIGPEEDLPRPKKIEINTELKERELDINLPENPIENCEKFESNIKETTHSYREHVENKVENNNCKRRSIYDESDEESNNGKLIEMDSFVAQLEQIRKESGLWKTDSKVINKKEQIGDNTKGNANNKTDSHIINNTETKDHKFVNINNNTDINAVDNSETNEDDIDFWSTIKKEEDDIIRPRHKRMESFENSCSTDYSEYNSSVSIAESKSLPQNIQNPEQEQYDTNKNKGNNVNCQSSIGKCDSYESSEEEASSSDDDYVDNDRKNDVNNNENEIRVPSIQERIQSLKESIKQKESKSPDQEIKICVREKVTALEITNQSRSKTTSTKSSLKSFEEFSEEEDFDSGVTSDMSRHISDTEEFPELKKLTKYQRAATHSRLFKLLQDECDNEADDEDDKLNGNDTPRRDQLSLPLNKSETFSICSSGVSSPNSAVNEKLVEELVQSLLKRKKGQAFRNVPKEKLVAAATRILQEDIENAESHEDCSSFLSPLRGSTGYSTAAQTPQEFNDEYNQYYESWRENDKFYDENYDILPSKAFKLLQEHSNLSKTGAIAGLLAKCPRVLSSKNIHKRLMKLLESSECPSPNLDKPLDSNEVTSAS